MNFTEPIISLQADLTGTELAMAEMGVIDCLNEKKFLALNLVRNKYIKAIQILEVMEL